MRCGLLNMMPDAALRVTERQFAALCGLASPADLVLFGLTGVDRGPAVAEHVARRYRPAADLAHVELDLLVISGANVSAPDLPGQPFWDPLCRVFATAAARGLPTLFSCLATHAVLAAVHGEIRRPVVPKVWGVFEHAVAVPDHPLCVALPAAVPVPHSRHNQVDANQFARAGYTVLLTGDGVGPHLAVSADGRRLLMQGHPEYDAVSLLKEYKREVGLWQDGVRTDFPPLPGGYLDAAGETLLRRHADRCRRGPPWPRFPEPEVTARLTAPWSAPAAQVVANWLRGIRAGR